MLTLPRGAFNGHDNVLLASAEWARPEDVARLPYQPGCIFLGAYPYEDTWPKLIELRSHFSKRRDELDKALLNPVQRAQQLATLDALWLKALAADCMPIGIADDRHLITIAGARSGKGLSAIVPNLCLYPGSVVCLDPKGENATLTAARRGQGDEWCQGLGQEVYVLDPFGVANVRDDLRASLNPLALLDPTSTLIVDDAALLAEGLILPDGDEGSHWTETARNLVRGVILHLVDTQPGATLFDVRRLLTAGDARGFAEAVAAKKVAEQAMDNDPSLDIDLHEILPNDVRNAFAFLLWRMRKSLAFGGAVAGTAESMLDTGENERGSILSTARRNTAFLDTLGDRYKGTLSGAFRPFDPDLLKASSEGVTVYLCLPAERMGTHGRWLRMMIGQCLERLQRQRIPPASGVSVLFLLEEFFALGTMPAIEKAAGYAAGFGVKLWAILQDLQQIKSLYKTSWQTFLANAGAVQIFGASDRDTLNYASQAIGEFEVSRVTDSVSTNTAQGETKGSALTRYGPGIGGRLGWMRAVLPDVSRSTNTATSESKSVGLHIVPLLRPDEIALQFAREAGAMLVLAKGQRPMWLLRANYHETPWFWGTYTPPVAWCEKKTAGRKPAPFWDRPREPFRQVVEHFNRLAEQISQL